MGISDKLKEIADAIRKVKGTTNKIKPDNFAKEISDMKYLSPEDMKNLKSENILRGDYSQNLISIMGIQGALDRVRTFNTYLGGSKYYGIQVADCARSYHMARMIGLAQFRYSQSKGMMNGDILTDSEGRCYLDCSSFVGLCLRGIEFKNTPYYTHLGEKNLTYSSLGKTNRMVSELCENSNYDWADIYLDRQTTSTLPTSFKEGYRSVRTSAEIAEYYYAQGCTLYEYSKGNPPTSVPNNLLPGDLIFWSRDNASDMQKSRFKAISHVGIVSRNTSKFYQVTGYRDERITSTIFCSNIVDRLNEITLIIRPNYNPVLIPKTPNNINLLPQYMYDGLNVTSSVTIDGVAITANSTGGFQIKRMNDSTQGRTFYLYRYDNPITLTPGTYELSGCPEYIDLELGRELYWGLSMRKASDRSDVTDSITGNRIWDKGNGCTFTLNDTIDVYVYFYMSKECTDTSVYTVVPSLIKTSGDVIYETVDNYTVSSTTNMPNEDGSNDDGDTGSDGGAD